jgi:(p)ppGpp synthase/HD superfamily hydrolase
MVEAAVRLAARGHYHQFRKRDRQGQTPLPPGNPLPEDHIPYITHLMGTVAILARVGARDEVLAAAVLHDYLEDVPDPDGRARIVEKTNTQVLDLVLAVTEDKRPGLNRGETWHIRKKENLDTVASMPSDAALIKAADALHNLLSLEIDLAEAPDPQAVWGRFNAPKEHQLWYFKSTLDAVARRLGDHPIVTELEGVVDRLGA